MDPFLIFRLADILLKLAVCTQFSCALASPSLLYILTSLFRFFTYSLSCILAYTFGPMLDSAGVHLGSVVCLPWISIEHNISCHCVCIDSSSPLFSLPHPSFCSLGSGLGRGERAKPPGGRAADCHVLWPSAPTHERTDWPVGAGSSGPPRLLQRAQWNPVLLSGGMVLNLSREIKQI